MSLPEVAFDTTMCPVSIQLGGVTEQAHIAASQIGQNIAQYNASQFINQVRSSTEAFHGR